MSPHCQNRGAAPEFEMRLWRKIQTNSSAIAETARVTFVLSASLSYRYSVSRVPICVTCRHPTIRKNEEIVVLDHHCIVIFGLTKSSYLNFYFKFHILILFIPCGRLSWLPVSFLLHVKYTLPY